MKIQLHGDSLDFPGLRRFLIAKKVIQHGKGKILWEEGKRRLFSTRYFLILYQYLDPNPPLPLPKIPVHLRPLQAQDVSILFNFDQKDLPPEGIMERIRLLPLLSSGFEAFVVATDEEKPCHVFWVLTSQDNPLIEKFFGGRILPLAEDEYIVEGAFTLEEYRRMGILHWRRLVLFKALYERGLRKVINYIRSDNLPSLLSCRGQGYTLTMIRKDQWRFFKNRFTFIPVPAGTPYPLDVKRYLRQNRLG